jgi:2-polyprenyl-3-methyl-5-hydroxy-6-metoxy-1,4-benzoquinol methylase
MIVLRKTNRFIYVNVRGKPKKIKKSMSYNWDYLDTKSYNNKVGQYKFRREFDFIINNAKNNFERVLDIAGGSGRFSIPLREYSKKITVIDINQTAIQMLKERDMNINAICGDFIKTEIQGTYSAIICIEALGYFDNLELFFNKINSLLSNDGRFILHYNNPRSWRYLLRKIKHWRSRYYPYHEINIKELIKILSGCNLEIENMSGMNWIPLPLSSNSRLVSFFEKIEKILRLEKWYSQSPWILMSIKKQTEQKNLTN